MRMEAVELVDVEVREDTAPEDTELLTTNEDGADVD